MVFKIAHNLLFKSEYSYCLECTMNHKLLESQVLCN